MSAPKWVELVHPKTSHHYTCHAQQLEMWLKRGWQKVTDDAGDSTAPAAPASATSGTALTKMTPASAPTDTSKEA